MNKANLSVARAAPAGLGWAPGGGDTWRRVFQVPAYPSVLFGVWHTQPRYKTGHLWLRVSISHSVPRMAGRGGCPRGWDTQLAGRREGGLGRLLLVPKVPAGSAGSREAPCRRSVGAEGLTTGRTGSAGAPMPTHVRTRCLSVGPYARTRVCTLWPRERANTRACTLANTCRPARSHSSAERPLPLQNVDTHKAPRAPAQNRKTCLKGREVGNCPCSQQSPGLRCSTLPPPRRRRNV